MFVPQQEAWIVERMGKFNRILDPGLNILMPFIDRVKYVQSLKEIAIDVPKQSAITVDNVTLGIDGVLYLRILDPYLGMIFSASAPDIFHLKVKTSEAESVFIILFCLCNYFSFLWC